MARRSTLLSSIITKVVTDEKGKHSLIKPSLKWKELMHAVKNNKVEKSACRDLCAQGKSSIASYRAKLLDNMEAFALIHIDDDTETKELWLDAAALAFEDAIKEVPFTTNPDIFDRALGLMVADYYASKRNYVSLASRVALIESRRPDSFVRDKSSKQSKLAVKKDTRASATAKDGKKPLSHKVWRGPAKSAAFPTSKLDNWEHDGKRICFPCAHQLVKKGLLKNFDIPPASVWHTGYSVAGKTFKVFTSDCPLSQSDRLALRTLSESDSE